MSIRHIRVNVDASPDRIGSYLVSRQRDKQFFRIEARTSRSFQIVFPGAYWLFKLVIKLWHAESGWQGVGAFEGNATRLFSAIAADLSWDHLEQPPVHFLHLIRQPQPSSIRGLTLDGKDNFIPNELARGARDLDWCVFTQNYLDAIAGAVDEMIGNVSEFFSGQTGSQAGIIQLPASSTWTFKEVEVYTECCDPEAIARVAELAAAARRFANEVSVSERHFESVDSQSAASAPPRYSEDRTFDMPSLRVGLGARGVSLNIYAKAMDRLRLEVAYRHYPSRAARVTEAADGRASGTFAEHLSAIRGNALRRTDRFLACYRELGQTRRTQIAPLMHAMLVVAQVCDRSGINLNRVLTPLIFQGGISVLGNYVLQEVVDELVQRRVLIRANVGLRGQPRYVAAQELEAGLRHMRLMTNG